MERIGSESYIQQAELFEELCLYTDIPEIVSAPVHIRNLLENAIGSTHTMLYQQLKDQGIRREALHAADGLISQTHFRIEPEKNGFGVMSCKERILVHQSHQPQHIEQHAVVTSKQFVQYIFNGLLEALRHDAPEPELYDDLFSTSIVAIDTAGLWIKLHDHFMPAQGETDGLARTYQFAAAMSRQVIDHFIERNAENVESSKQIFGDYTRAYSRNYPSFTATWVAHPLEEVARDKVLRDLVRHMNFHVLPLAQIHDLSDYRK